MRKIIFAAREPRPANGLQDYLTRFRNVGDHISQADNHVIVIPVADLLVLKRHDKIGAGQAFPRSFRGDDGISATTMPRLASALLTGRSKLMNFNELNCSTGLVYRQVHGCCLTALNRA